MPLPKREKKIDLFRLVYSVCLHHAWSFYVCRNIRYTICNIQYTICPVGAMAPGLRQRELAHAISSCHPPLNGNIDFVSLPQRPVLASKIPSHTMLATNPWSQLWIMPTLEHSGPYQQALPVLNACLPFLSATRLSRQQHVGGSPHAHPLTSPAIAYVSLMSVSSPGVYASKVHHDTVLYEIDHL